MDDRYSETFDHSKDGIKRMNPGNSLFALKDGVRTASAKFPYPEGERIIPLGLRLREGGTYTLTAEKAQIANGHVAYLVDTREGTATRLSADAAYTFTAPGGDLEGRFHVQLKQAGDEETPLADAPHMGTYFDGNTLTLLFSGSDMEETQLTVTDLMGRELYRADAAFNSGPVRTDFHAPAAGVYVVNARHGSTSLSQRAVYMP